MTIEGIAQRAGVSAQTVYAIFKSKTGILIALLDQTMFGPEYNDVVRQAPKCERPRNPFAARGERCQRDYRRLTKCGVRPAAGRRRGGARVGKIGTTARASPLRSGGRHDHLPSRSRKASTRTYPQDRTGYLLDAHWRGCVPGCWCESVDGLLTNIKNGWPTLSFIRCWLPEDRVRCKAGNGEEIDMSVAVTALHDKFELERTNHGGRGRRSQTAAVFLRCLGKA